MDAAPPASGHDWLLFGLGNPGGRYAATRHNLGWRLVDLLARRFAVPLRAGRGDYFCARHMLPPHRVHLIKPTTYMNLSGRAVRQYLAIERPSAPEIVVAVDDVYLPLGRLRLRPRGSAGGHNGLTSVITLLNTEEFGRVRMGVGPGPAGADRADFVLEEFSSQEQSEVEPLLARAADACVEWIENGCASAMARYNG